MTVLCRVHEAMLAAVRTFLIGLFLMLVAVVFFQVIARYVFDAPPFWTEELARFTLIWITFVGAGLVHQRGEHIAVNSFRDTLPRRPRALLDILISLLVLAVLIVFAKAGLSIVAVGTQTAPALGISMRYVYGALLVGTALMILVTVTQLVVRLSALSKGAD